MTNSSAVQHRIMNAFSNIKKWKDYELVLLILLISLRVNISTSMKVGNKVAVILHSLQTLREEKYLRF